MSKSEIKPNESAAAFLFVVKRILKWIVFLLLGVVGIVALSLGGFWLWNYVTFEYPKSKVMVSVARDDQMCTKEYPFLVKVINKSNRKILSYSFRFVVRRKGRSTNLASWQSVSDDKIIAPKEGWATCYRIKSTESTYRKAVWISEKDIDVSIKNFRPTFE